MRRSTAAALIAILLFAVFARLVPVSRFVYWGADVGEYHRLTHAVVTNGHLGTEYYGWGSTYPYFPGLYMVTGGASLLGFDENAVLSIIPPLLNSLSVVLLFLIAVRLFRDERVGLVAAGVLAVSLPYLYTNSHPIPSSLGSILFLASVTLLLWDVSNKAKKLAMLLPLAAAIVVTHHLSTYFLIIAVLASVAFRSAVSSRFRWRTASVELVSLAFTLCVALPYWLLYAVPFRVNLLGDLGTMPWWGPFLGLAVALVAWGALVPLRRRVSWRFVPKYPSLRRGTVLLLVALAFVFGLTCLFTVMSVPGTSIKIPPIDVLYISPFLVLVAFSSAGRRLLDFAQGGLQPTGWFVALTFSLLAGSFVGERILIPYRHVDYLTIPVAIMVGAGITFLYDLAFANKRKGIVVASLCALLIVGNLPAAYPPSDIMVGYNEGTSSRSLVGTSWLSGHVTGLLAADHKASTIAFGMGNTNATWDTARNTFLAPDFAGAESEMLNVSSPSGVKRVDFVLVNVDTTSGTQLFPWEPAYRLSSAAQAKFELLPYQRFFDDGYTQVYFVNWGYNP